MNNLNEFSIKMVKTNKHDLYGLLFMLLKLGINRCGNNKCGKSIFCNHPCEESFEESYDENLLIDCLVTFIECDIFSNMSEDDIIRLFMAMKKRKSNALEAYEVSILILFLCKSLPILNVYVLSYATCDQIW